MDYLAFKVNLEEGSSVLRVEEEVAEVVVHELKELKVRAS